STRNREAAGSGVHSIDDFMSTPPHSGRRSGPLFYPQVIVISYSAPALDGRPFFGTMAGRRPDGGHGMTGNTRRHPPRFQRGAATLTRAKHGEWSRPLSLESNGRYLQQGAGQESPRDLPEGLSPGREEEMPGWEMKFITAEAHRLIAMAAADPGLRADLRALAE